MDRAFQRTDHLVADEGESAEAVRGPQRLVGRVELTPAVAPGHVFAPRDADREIVAAVTNPRRVDDRQQRGEGVGLTYRRGFKPQIGDLLEARGRFEKRPVE